MQKKRRSKRKNNRKSADLRV